eukprot:33449-Chlamydomonas_euryale.AAC.1
MQLESVSAPPAVLPTIGTSWSMQLPSTCGSHVWRHAAGVDERDAERGGGRGAAAGESKFTVGRENALCYTLCGERLC